MEPGKVQTVLGWLPADELGITLPHEHVLVDFTKGMVPAPLSLAPKDLASMKPSLENLDLIRRYPYSVRDNVVLDDVGDAISELELFHKAGGRTICNLSVIGMRGQACNPKSLVEISSKTGLNIVHTCGLYAEGFISDEIKAMSTRRLADMLISEITEGVDGVKCGLVYIGCSFPLSRFEKRSLEAGVVAQKETGVALCIRPGLNPAAPFEAMNYLSFLGVAMKRTSMSHIARTITSRQHLNALAMFGCYINHSFFGKECGFMDYHRAHDMPTDATRINNMKFLIDSGYEDQLLMSHDITCKHELVRNGGHGYAHVLESVVPRMESKGITKDTIEKMLVKNPQRYLSFQEANYVY